MSNIKNKSEVNHLILAVRGTGEWSPVFDTTNLAVEVTAVNHPVETNIPSAITVLEDEPYLLGSFLEFAANHYLDDIYANGIIDYVLYRAYMKDAEFAGNNQRASSHYQLFVGSVTQGGQVSIMVRWCLPEGVESSDLFDWHTPEELQLVEPWK